MASRNAWARLSAWAFFCFATTPLAHAGDLLLSPKEQATSIHLGDDAYVPGGGFRIASVLRFHPFLRQRVDFDDNAFLDDDDVTRALFYAATGGARLDLLPGNHEFTLGYKARGTVRLASWGPEYTNPAEKAAYENRIDGLTRVEHVVDLRNVVALPWGRFELRGNYESLSDPLNFTTTRHIRRNVWSGAFEGLVEFVRFRMEGGAGVQRFDFRGAFDYLDDLKWQVFGRIGYQLGPKLFLVAEYEYGEIRYESLTPAQIAAFGPHANTKTHTITLGLRGNLSARVEVLVRGGATYQIVEGSNPDEEDGIRFFGSVRFLWKLTPRSSIDASYLRDVQISQLASYQVVDRGELKVKYALSYFVTSILYGYVENTAPSSGDGFLRYGAGLQLDYRMTRWLATGMGYEWRGRDTEIPGARFTNHRVSVHFTLIF
ncbi:MAG: hypothetical protein ACYS47_16265 [Planctomycetota bacterium]|jgi:hypothetical protein